MKILITGVAGYIGSEVARQAVYAGHEVSGFDSFDSTLYSSEIKRKRANKLEKVVGVEVKDYSPLSGSPNVFHWEDFDCIINEMAVPGLAPSWSQFGIYVDSNLRSVEALMRILMERNPTARFVQASTSSVYGNTSEDKSLSPLSPYGVTKLAAENLLNSFRSQHGLDLSILRYFSVFGGDQRPDMAYAKFIRQIERGMPVTIFGDGSQSRTNTHVSDVARATLLAAESIGRNFTIDISGKKEVSLMQALSELEKALGKKAIVNFQDVQPGDQVYSRGDIVPAWKILGWQPEITFEEGIRDQVAATRIRGT